PTEYPDDDYDDDVDRRINTVHEIGSGPPELLRRCRLDRQAQLARTLRQWADPGPSDVADARLILARANLGALVEGTMQLLLSVWLHDFRREFDREKEPPELMLHSVQTFFSQNVWTDAERAVWDPWVTEVRKRRNAVHAFCDRDLGEHADFLADVRRYLHFMKAINSRLPYP
ncbi:MAG: hypothetical protein AB1938_22535, partial [Myxococcota bacterium]